MGVFFEVDRLPNTFFMGSRVGYYAEREEGSTSKSKFWPKITPATLFIFFRHIPCTVVVLKVLDIAYVIFTILVTFIGYMIWFKKGAHESQTANY